MNLPDAIQLLLLLVQLVLLVSVVWYTWETRRMRVGVDEQLKLLRRQFEIGIVPYLEIWVDEFRVGGSRFADGHPLRTIKGTYRCQISNPTDRIAHHVRVLVYDSNFGYFWSLDGLESIRDMGNTRPVEVSAAGPLENSQQAYELILSEYESRGEEVWQSICQSKSSFVAAIFRDANDGIHLIKRPFMTGVDGRPKMSLSDRNSLSNVKQTI